MLNLLRKLKLLRPKPEPARIVQQTIPVVPFNRESTLLDWRQNKNLVAEMRRLLDSPFGQDMLGVLDNELAVRMTQPDPTQVALELGRVAAHRELIGTLMLMATLHESPREPNVTYRKAKQFRNPHEPDDY